MRREHKITESYVDWLKSLGCVFYSPLTEFETRDLISGQPMQQGNNGSVTWDPNEQAWYFQDLYQNTFDVIASWQGLNLPFDTTNIGFSLCYEIKLVQNGYNQWSSALGMCLPLILGGRTAGFNAQNMVTSLNVWTKCAVVFPKYEGVSRYSYLYKNGDEIHSDNRGNTIFTGNSLTNTRIDSNHRNSTAYSNAKYYMRNAMFFDVNLSQAQIREIQQIQ